MTKVSKRHCYCILLFGGFLKAYHALELLECTFIIMDKSKFDESQDELASIVGDTNLFFESCGDTDIARSAEIEVMIAEPWARRKGLAIEALQLMIRFGVLIVHMSTIHN